MTNRACLVMLVCACSGGSTPTDAAHDPRQVVATLPARANRNLDVLFVIDDTNADRQTEIAAGLSSLIEMLSLAQGGLPDLHIGVVSSDMGTKSSTAAPAPDVGVVGQGGCASVGKDGRLLTNGASISNSGVFLTDTKDAVGGRVRNFTGSLDAVLTQMLRLGATGCGFEQPLNAMKRAIENTQANAGFLRPDAKLAIILAGDEDDCSVRDPALFEPDSPTLGPLTSFRCTRFGVTCDVGGKTPDEMNVVGAKAGCTSSVSGLLDDARGFAAFVKSVKSDPRDVFAAVIAGDPAPVVVEQRQVNGMNQIALAHTCPFPPGPVADPAVRLHAFVQELAPSARSSTICQTDHTAALGDLGTALGLFVGNPCITHALAEPLDCIVEDALAGSTAPIAPCGTPRTSPCWELITDVARCPAAKNQLLVVTRDMPPHSATITTLRCKVQ